jgi:dienelactone hydrolase
MPSSEVDGGDLMGVFDRDASADASVDAATRDAGRRDAGPAPLASASAAPVKAAARPPTEGSCVGVEGLPDRDIKRTLGRPACRDAEVLEWKDDAGAPRYACVVAPRGVETRAPLPLVIFFHDAGDSPTSLDKKTTLRKLAARFDVTGDPAHAGFIVLSPQGRALHGNKEGALFDSDYTGEDNVDVATVDHFVGVLTQRNLIDRRRVYALGNGRGSHMAATYAMMRADRVAAFATYGSDAPRASWACPGPPPPALFTYRACDAIAPCDAVERWIRAREALGAETVGLRLGGGNESEPSCALDKKCTTIVGTAYHRRWPKGREEDVLRFFARHTLSVKP